MGLVPKPARQEGAAPLPEPSQPPHFTRSAPALQIAGGHVNRHPSTIKFTMNG